MARKIYLGNVKSVNNDLLMQKLAWGQSYWCPLQLKLFGGDAPSVPGLTPFSALSRRAFSAHPPPTYSLVSSSSINGVVRCGILLSLRFDVTQLLWRACLFARTWQGRELCCRQDKQPALSHGSTCCFCQRIMTLITQTSLRVKRNEFRHR